MKKVYPVILTPTDDGYGVYVPALEINTDGKNLADAIDMARDAICVTLLGYEDLGKAILDPDLTVKAEPGRTVTLVDVDIDAYRRSHENRVVKKNCTLPSWLNEKAEAAGLNFSQVLQEALKERLGTGSE